MALRFIGSGSTNSNGLAIMDKDANGNTIEHSYTGTGAGKLDLVASLMDLSNLSIVVNPSTINDTGSTYSLSATVTDNGSAVSGEGVVFELYKVSDDSLVDTLTAVTNSSGVATVSYVGKDAGSLYIQVRMFVSKTYSVIDGVYYDPCVTGSTASWVQNGTTGSNTLTNNGRVITGDNGIAMFFAQKVGQTGMYCWNEPLTVEFDAVSVTGAVRFQAYSSSTTVAYSCDFTQTGHWKFVYDGTNITAYLNGEQQVNPLARELTNSRIGFVAESGESITFKDFVIYPI